MSASRHHRRVLRCLAALACGIAMAGAFGQQASREQEQLRRLRLQVQKLQQDQVTQQDAAQRANAEKTAAMAQRDAALAALRGARSAAATQTQRSEAAQRQLDITHQQGAALQVRLDQLQAELKISRLSVEKLRADGTELQRRLALRESSYADLRARHVLQAQGLQTCSANNQALRDIGLDLLQRYANKSVADVLAQNEPFLQFKRVALENLLQAYQDKLDQQAVNPAPATAAGAGVAPPETKERSRAP